ncbi:MAG: ribonuclease P protein component 4 [Candidatus Helarchaeota archaeon]
MKRKGIKKEISKRIAKNRIFILLKNADRVFLKDKKLAQRYIDLVRKFSTKYRVRIPYEYKMRICNHCKSFLWPGINCRVRIRKDNNLKITVTCFECKRQMRLFYPKRKVKISDEEIRKNEKANQ